MLATGCCCVYLTGDVFQAAECCVCAWVHGVCVWRDGRGCGGLKRIKVTRCNRMALRVCVLEPERPEAPSLAELFKLCEPLQGIFSLSRHARSLTLSLSLCFSVSLHLPLPHFSLPLSPGLDIQ